MEKAVLRMRRNAAIVVVDTDNLFIKKESFCVAETDQGLDLGQVMCVKGCPNHGEVTGKIVRLATEEDLASEKSLEEVEEEALQVCKKKAAEKQLPMKLVTVKSLFDRTKLIFYFVAENRIDFRELVRELAAVFKTRIEMRQIGVRDESRIVCGYGSCGRSLCCTKFGGEFQPVSIKMAKEQGLNLNSQKISGICGRLLCCLAYEVEAYQELNRNLPQQGSHIQSGDVSCDVLAVDTLKEMIRLRYKDMVLDVHRRDLECRNGKYTISKEVIERLTHHEEPVQTDQMSY